MTKLNQQLLEMIQNSHGHLTAEDTFMMAKEKGLNVSMASTYRILSKLVNDGYLSKIPMPNHKDIFDKTVINHAHMVCDVCNSLEDVMIDGFDKVLSKYIKEYDSYELLFHHTCDKCKKIH